jgi:hypothetical protein
MNLDAPITLDKSFEVELADRVINFDYIGAKKEVTLETRLARTKIMVTELVTEEFEA